ncbi:MAG TPA: tyrosine-type recombinase/integrase [Azoarcus taiwanensis]|nr:tyrosine-type recombinase/integrase [Azoarcus taiwanensis]
MPSSADELIQTASSMHLWWQWLDGLLRADYSRTQILSAIAARHRRVDPGLASTLLGFAIDLLEGNSASGRTLSLRTVRDHVTATTPRLLAQFEPLDPATLDTAEIESHYTELLDLCTDDAEVRKLQVGLREFHHYLVRRHERTPIVRPGEVLGEGGELLPVDANLVSFDEYEQAQRRLDESILDGADEDDIVVCKLVLAFAFRLGMRRMEIFGLRIDDVHIHRGIHCLVQDYPNHRLKTTNSRRVLPAHAFLSPEERVLLKTWHARRVGEEPGYRRNKPHALLFARPAQGQERVSADGVTRRVCAALREVTGDRRLFMHHLRHSFATWNYLALRMGSLDAVADLFCNLPATQRWLHQHRRRHALLLGTTKRPTSRTHGYAIARLLGHSSPAVSIAHYIHSTDLVLAAVLDRELDAGRTTLVAASGLARSTAYPLVSHSPFALVEYLLKRRAPGTAGAHKALTTAPVPSAPPTSPEGQTPSRWLSLRKVNVILRQATKGANPVALAVALGLQAETIKSICEDAHRWAAFIRPKESERMPPLTAARTHAERAFVKSLESRIRALYARNPELCVDGLTLHLRHYNRQKNDIVFKGAKETLELTRYLQFVRELEFADNELQTVLRQADGPTQPNWTARLKLPTRIRVIAPPTATKAQTYSQWVGILMTRPSATGCGALATTQCLLALVAIENLPNPDVRCVHSTS